MSLNPHVTDLGSKVRLDWTPDVTGQGYRLYVDGVAVSRTFKPEAKSTTFSKPDQSPHRYGVQKMDVVEALEEVTWPVPSGTPIPANGVITAAGTYSGTFSGTLRIQTSAPVTIRNALLSNLSGGPLIDAIPGGAVQLTLEHVSGKGGDTYQTSGRFLEAEGFKSVVIRSCTIEQTRGIEIQGLNSPADSSVLITLTKARNIKGGPDGNPVGNFVQFRYVNNTPSVEVSWVEMVNDFLPGNPGPEDAVSVYKSSHLNLHDFYFQGGYPVDLNEVYSGTGIVLSDSSSPTESGHNVARDGQVVAWTNVGAGISGGHDNLVQNVRCVSSGRDDAGNDFFSANVGLACYVDPIGPNNRFVGGYTGWMQGRRFGHPLSRADLYTPKAANNVEAENTWAYGNHSTPIAKADEQAEWMRWQQKVAAAGVTIGA